MPTWPRAKKRLNTTDFTLTRKLTELNSVNEVVPVANAFDQSAEAVNQRFWSKVDKTPGHGPNGDCWIWSGVRQHKKEPRGYGMSSGQGFRMGFPRNMLAHRKAYFLVHGRLEKNLQVCHTCDNPPCVRPDHLFQGTGNDNQRDAYVKGRQRYYQDNIKRLSEMTHCRRGHAFTAENTYIMRYENGKRMCKKCQNLMHSLRRKRKRKESHTLLVTCRL